MNDKMNPAACAFGFGVPENFEGYHFGLTKFELIAAMSLQGMLSNPAYSETSPFLMADSAVKMTRVLIAAIRDEQKKDSETGFTRAND